VIDMKAGRMEGNGQAAELRAFLLGTLDETEVERIEYSILSRPEIYELLQATEEELIDEYVSGRLSEAEVASLVSYLERLPGGKDRIDFARRLRRNLSTGDERRAAPASRRRPTWQWAAAAALVAALGVSAYLTLVDREPQTLMLTADLTRSSGQIPEARRAESGGAIRVLLELGNSTHGRYRATLYDADSRARASFDELAAETTERLILVGLDLNVAGLKPGDYSIELEGEAAMGFEPLGRYVFRLIE
jgi:hypothetical protein